MSISQLKESSGKRLKFMGNLPHSEKISHKIFSLSEIKCQKLNVCLTRLSCHKGTWRGGVKRNNKCTMKSRLVNNVIT